MFWKCNLCGWVFEKPVMLKEDDGLDSPPYRYTGVCPGCYRNDYDEYIEDLDEEEDQDEDID